jgi:hypothetical protein
VLNTVANGAADCVAQCAADYTNRQGHMCSDQGYGTFHVNWYCEAGDGPNGPGENLGVYLSVNAADCVAQCTVDYAHNRQGLMCHWAGFDQMHTLYYCEAGSGPSPLTLNGAGEDLDTYLVLNALPDGAADCVAQCTVDYGHNRQGLMCNDQGYGALHTTWYCEAGESTHPNGAGEDLGTYLFHHNYFPVI